MTSRSSRGQGLGRGTEELSARLEVRESEIRTLWDEAKWTGCPIPYPRCSRPEGANGTGGGYRYGELVDHGHGMSR